jgi:hypothetical protein
MVQQYKIDRHNRVQRSVTREQFEHASAVRSVKAPELWKRVRATLKPFGYYQSDFLGNYCCKIGKKKFAVNLDFGGRSAQLRYSVVRPEFKGVHPLSQFRFERALGFGLGDWDYIVDENVDDVFSLFGDLVQYCFDLPDRIKAAMKAAGWLAKLGNKLFARKLLINAQTGHQVLRRFYLSDLWSSIYLGCQSRMTLAKKETPPRINRIPNPRITQSGKPTDRRIKNGPLRFPAKAL